MNDSLHRYRPQLDGIRAIAVLSVLWYHWVPLGDMLAGFGCGELGVHCFFVLSGYLITGILFRSQSGSRREKVAAIGRFYLRRMIRLFPIYYIMLLFLILIDLPPYRDSWPWHALYLQNFYMQEHGRDLWGSHLWTLAVEEQFYLVWPLFIFCLSRFRVLILVLILAAIASAPLMRYLAWSCGWSWDPNLFPVGAVDCLGGGALLAFLERHCRVAIVDRVCSGLLVVGSIVIVASQNSESLALQAVRQNASGMVFMWVVWQAARGIRGPIGKFLEFKPASYLGKISYGVYLIHGFAPAIWLWFFWSAPIPGYRLFDKMGISSDSFESPWIQLAINCCITLGLAVISWHFLESPVNRLKQRYQ